MQQETPANEPTVPIEHEPRRNEPPAMMPRPEAIAEPARPRPTDRSAEADARHHEPDGPRPESNSAAAGTDDRATPRHEPAASEPVAAPPTPAVAPASDQSEPKGGA
jgi:hypothetical protein